jgi:hypothetical protein
LYFGLAVKELVGNNVSGRSACDLSYGKNLEIWQKQFYGLNKKMENCCC